MIFTYPVDKFRRAIEAARERGVNPEEILLSDSLEYQLGQAKILAFRLIISTACLMVFILPLAILGAQIYASVNRLPLTLDHNAIIAAVVGGFSALLTVGFKVTIIERRIKQRLKDGTTTNTTEQ